MKRTTMFMSLALIALVIPGCSTASAQCPGGRCYTASVWSPWAGFYYSNSPCAGGPRAAAGDALPAADAAVGGEAPAGDKGSRPSAVAEEPAEPRLADTAPQLVEFKPFCLRVAEIVNAQRAALGLAPLQLDENLCSGCDRHSAWMASGGGLQHGYYTGSRECIAYGVRSPEAVVNLWLNSSGHRAIILGGGRTLGVGCSGNYWTLRVR